MYAPRNFSQLFWRLVGIALGESHFFQTLVFLPNKNGVFSKHSRSPVGFPAQANATLSQASVSPRHWRWGRCLRSLLGVCSTCGTSRFYAPPGSLLTGPMVSLLQMTVGPPVNQGHLHFQAGVPWRSLLAHLALSSRSFGRCLLRHWRSLQRSRPVVSLAVALFYRAPLARPV